MAGGEHVHNTGDIIGLGDYIRSIVHDEIDNTPPPTPDPEPEPQYKWPRPALENPMVFNPPPTGRFTVTIPSGRDAIVVCPPGGRQGATVITGGRSVVIDGGRWNVDANLPIPNQVGGVDDTLYRVFTATGQTGELWIANVTSDNPNNRHADFLAGGGNIWTLQNCRLTNQRGKEFGWHSDAVQPWNPLQLIRVDRLTLYTNYQGFYFYGGNRPSSYNLNRMDLHHVAYDSLPRQSSLFWTGGTSGTMSEVFAETSGRPIDGDNGPVRWTVGNPPGGEFATGSA